nr:hypothetical protein [Tanacetum cinerariifolium]
MDKGKGHILGADDKGFIKVKRRKSGGNKGGNKLFKSISVKPKTHYRPKAKQLTTWTTSSAGNGLFSICNSFEVLNVDISITEEVATGSKVTTS